MTVNSVMSYALKWSKHVVLIICIVVCQLFNKTALGSRDLAFHDGAERLTRSSSNLLGPSPALCEDVTDDYRNCTKNDYWNLGFVKNGRNNGNTKTLESFYCNSSTGCLAVAQTFQENNCKLAANDVNKVMLHLFLCCHNLKGLSFCDQPERATRV